MKGGDFKKSQLVSLVLIKTMNLGNQLLHHMLVDLTTVLAASYPQTIEEENQIAKMESIWQILICESCQIQKRHSSIGSLTMY